jgi:hypothetical protein
MPQPPLHFGNGSVMRERISVAKMARSRLPLSVSTGSASRSMRACSSLFIQTVCALRFFYHTTLGVSWMIEHMPYPLHQKKLPMVLSRADVAALVTTPRNRFVY